MSLFYTRRKNMHDEPEKSVLAASRQPQEGYFRLSGDCSGCGEKELYSLLRQQVPVIDACIQKIIRLSGGFKAVAIDERFQDELDAFSKNVSVGASGRGLNSFLDCWLDSMLTYGASLGEMVYSLDAGGISGLYVAPMKRIEIRQGAHGREYYILGNKSPLTFKRPENILFTALCPSAENPYGVSILRGLPGLSSILLRIYETVGQNFERVGNVRYAVTYKPATEGDRSFSKERAQQIAKEWSNGMAASKSGDVRDFVAVGDVSIKAIGADNQVLDTEIPVRQILEQLIAKLGIPPFLLGLNWSTSERMSEQQADILTSELEYYRRLITPVLETVCSSHLRLLGASDGAVIEWENVNLQDETETALARLRNAQARKIELENLKEEKAVG